MRNAIKLRVGQTMENAAMMNNSAGRQLRNALRLTFQTFFIGAMFTTALGSAESLQDLAQQIAGVMSQSPSGKVGQRFVYVKGIVCEGGDL